MIVTPAQARGLFLVDAGVFRDRRGTFTKTFHEGIFHQHGLEGHFAEQYVTGSTRGVLRGMHFQMPPHDHAKLVFCVAGRILDVVVDLRVGSPTFRQAFSFELDADKGIGLFIGKGFAHGFYVLDGHALMLYNVSTTYTKESDSGIRWNSIDFHWPDPTPVISERDAGFVSLADFVSPFAVAE